MKLQDFLPFENIIVGFKADSKAQALRQLAQVAAEKTGLDGNAIAEGLLGRERLGSTGIGDGVAIPHARLPIIEENLCLCVKLAKPMDFEALDEKPVGIIVLLLSPADEGRDALNILSCVARKFREDRVLPLMSQARSAEEIYAILTGMA
jgi:nitrogen PTS system EIIA component